MKPKNFNDADFYQAIKDINDYISSYLTVQEIELIATESKFVRRTSAVLQGYDFLFISLICSKEDSHSTLEDMVDMLQKIGVNITKQSLDERIDSSHAVDFLHKCLERLIEKKIEKSTLEIPPDILKMFSKVLVQDSTVICLHEKLSKFFKGSGGRASKSALKIDVIYDLKTKQFESFFLTDMKTTDQTNSKIILQHTTKNSLIIRDLGYIKLDDFQVFEEKEAFYLSRFKNNWLVFKNKSDSTPLELDVFLNDELATSDIVDTILYITEKKVPVRFVAYRCPENVIDKRRRIAHQTAKKQGRTLSAVNVALMAFTIFITNVPKEIWEAKIIGTVYKLRWEIELIFKSWKSVIGIHILKGIKHFRIRVLIISRLILVTIFTAIYSIIATYCEINLQRELSMFKVFKWLQIDDELFKIFSSGLGEQEVNRLVKRGIKDVRKRQTTQQKIKEKIPFLELFEEAHYIKTFLS